LLQSLSLPPSPLQELPWSLPKTHMPAGPDDGLHVTWYDDRDGSYEIYYKYFDGTTWGPDTRVSNAPLRSMYASVETDDSGLVHIVWQDERTGDTEIYYRSYDGIAWTETMRLTHNDAYSGRPCVAVCPAAMAHVVWYNNVTGTNPEIYYRRWTGTAMAGIADLVLPGPVPTKTGSPPTRPGMVARF
jgi:hypothetical protein